MDSAKQHAKRPVQLGQRILRQAQHKLEIHQQVHRGNLNRLSSLMMRHWPELDTCAEWYPEPVEGLVEVA